MARPKIKKLSPRNEELKDSLELKDEFFGKRHQEKKDLVYLRQKFAVELMSMKDKIAVKRHHERIDIMSKRLPKN